MNSFWEVGLPMTSSLNPRTSAELTDFLFLIGAGVGVTDEIKAKLETGVTPVVVEGIGGF